MAQEKKVTFRQVLRYLRKKIPLNIGTVIFGLVFLYMVISGIRYISSDHLETYVVTAGPLAKNQTYTALALREEQMMSASTSGYITYYAASHTKVSKSKIVYTLGSNPTTASMNALTEEDYARIRSSLAAFSAAYDPCAFNSTYRYKQELLGIVQQYGMVSDENYASVTVNGASVYTSPADGVIVYSMDGYEDLELDDLCMDWFNQNNYHFTNLQVSGKISSGDAVYKLVTEETWSILIPITSEQVVQLAQRSTIRVKFLKDDATQVGTLAILTDDAGLFYAQITFSNGMIRYASERFLEVELVTNLKTGLKIPLSSIVTKDFYVIPKEFAPDENSEDTAGFYVVTGVDSEGENTVQFQHTAIYHEDEEYYYVDLSAFPDGTVLVKPNSRLTYTVEKTNALEGVYCINKGYAVFRKIIKIEQNNEYCIVETGTDYGISQFDYIIRNGDSVKENTILYE